ncbi:MAG: NfeD family protein [Paludibacteraceae bacterium]|nr:NfeD family protein [Paludibacteraceae bacterium]
MIGTFIDWFSNLEPGIKIYWAIALISSVIFVIQTIVSFIGIGDFDVDIDMNGGDGMDSSGFSDLLSMRNAINFMLGFSWAGVCFYDKISNGFILALIAILCGLAFVAIFIYVFKKMMKLESNGAYDINTAIGKTCDVYLRIPANRSGSGKVQISFNGSIQEIDAVTDGEMIPSGSKVTVVEILNNKILRVEKV